MQFSLPIFVILLVIMNNQQRRHRSVDNELARGMGMLERGATQRQVAETLGVNQSVICRAWIRYQRQGNFARRHGGGRQRMTNRHDDRFLLIQARRNRFATATQLRSDLINATGVNVSTQSVRNRLHENGLRSQRACIRIPLTRNHRQARLNWARQHANWTIQNWQPVLFTDESRFCLDVTDRRARVWRLPGERFHAANVSEHDIYGGGSLMVWGGISWVGRIDLQIVQNGTLTGLRYGDDIIDVHVRPYAGAIGDAFLLTDDNARPYRARVVQQYLEDETIERLDWPARSTDLNPIEHVWNMLQVALSRRPVQPRSLEHLGNALVAEWNNLPQSTIQTLIRSMRRRCQAVIDADGSHTRY